MVIKSHDEVSTTSLTILGNEWAIAAVSLIHSPGELFFKSLAVFQVNVSSRFQVIAFDKTLYAGNRYLGSVNEAVFYQTVVNLGGIEFWIFGL